MDFITLNFEMIKILDHTRESHPCSNDPLCGSDASGWRGRGWGRWTQWRGEWGPSCTL